MSPEALMLANWIVICGIIWERIGTPPPLVASVLIGCTVVFVDLLVLTWIDRARRDR